MSTSLINRCLFYMKIKQLASDQYHSIKKLFKDCDTNAAAIYGVIECLLPGQVWVDDLVEPAACLILCNDPYCFMGGNPSNDIWNDFIFLLKKKADVRLQIHHDKNMYLQQKILTAGFSILARREYKYNNVVDIPAIENHTSYFIKKIANIEMFNQCQWKELIIDIYQDPHIYLKNGAGFILWDEEKQLVVSEAHGICSREFLEIATITHESYRGQGLASIICNHIIHYAINNHLIPVYACNDDNIASWKVAEHNRMNNINRYNFYVLHK